jgi:hypothetical protein
MESFQSRQVLDDLDGKDRESLIIRAQSLSMRSSSDLLEVRAGIVNVSQRQCKVDYAGQAKCVASSDVNVGVQQANVFGVHNSPCKGFLLTSYLQGKVYPFLALFLHYPSLSIIQSDFHDVHGSS